LLKLQQRRDRFSPAQRPQHRMRSGKWSRKIPRRADQRVMTVQNSQDPAKAMTVRAVMNITLMQVIITRQYMSMIFFLIGGRPLG
jgi:hypothetical protein